MIYQLAANSNVWWKLGVIIHSCLLATSNLLTSALELVHELYNGERYSDLSKLFELKLCFRIANLGHWLCNHESFNPNGLETSDCWKSVLIAKKKGYPTDFFGNLELHLV